MMQVIFPMMYQVFHNDGYFTGPNQCGFYLLMILLFLGQSFLANPSGYKSWFHMPFRQVSYQLDAIFRDKWF